MQCENSGIKLNGEFLSNLRFADDVVLINENIILLQKISEEFLEVSGRDGLVPKRGKTQLLSNNKKVEKFEIKREK